MPASLLLVSFRLLAVETKPSRAAQLSRMSFFRLQVAFLLWHAAVVEPLPGLFAPVEIIPAFAALVTVPPFLLPASSLPVSQLLSSWHLSGLLSLRPLALLQVAFVRLHSVHSVSLSNRNPSILV